MNKLKKAPLIAVTMATLATGPGSDLHAVNGVLDTVIIVADETDLYKWPREKMEWTRVVTQLRKIVERNEQLLKRVGTASSSAPAAAGTVASVTDATAVALALESRAKAQDRGKSEYGLQKRKGATLQPGMKVEANMEIFGSSQPRDARRYEPFALQEALRERHLQALENQDKVLQKEFSAQKRLLEKLRSSKTDADLQSVQAAIAASQQRLELARQKTVQARDECQLLAAELEAERARKGEADREWEETFVEKLRARAMTSLHAQKGENS